MQKDNTSLMLIVALIGPIGGVGQRGGASPIIWLAVLLIMLIAYKELHKGVSIHDRITALKIVLWILSYVDDNTILQGFGYDDSIEHILNEMRKCIMTWKNY